MIKSIYLFASLSIIIACNGEQGQKSTSKKQTGSTPIETDTFFIQVDTADEMRSSYLQSISTDTPARLQSWNIDADALRAYLADGNIKEVNIALAHTMEYIDNGHYGIPAGLSPEALTIVVRGVAANGNLINYNTSYVLDRAKPCPPICLTMSSKKN